MTTNRQLESDCVKPMPYFLFFFILVIIDALSPNPNQFIHFEKEKIYRLVFLYVFISFSLAGAHFCKQTSAHCLTRLSWFYLFAVWCCSSRPNRRRHKAPTQCRRMRERKRRMKKTGGASWRQSNQKIQKIQKYKKKNLWQQIFLFLEFSPWILILLVLLVFLGEEKKK